MKSLPPLLATSLGLLLSTASFAAVPVADALAVTALEDKGKVFTVTATDADPGSALAYQVATPPANGKLIGTGPTFIYVPSLNYNGADSFTFTAHDGQNQSAPATVSITVTPVAEPAAPGAAFAEFVDPNPNPGNRFGDSVVALNTGNVVITSPWDDAGGTDAGAVYLFNGATGALISTLRGSAAGDNVGGVVALSNGNYVVGSGFWNHGAGAATWCDGNTGLNGVVSSSNSLVGSTAGDFVGNVTALSNGNYVVSSPEWSNGAATAAGAVTWGNGSTGTSGVVSASNSLVGSTAEDYLASNGVIALGNGNYVVISPNWNNGAVALAGAVTWGNGSTGISGVVSSSNSLVGSTPYDQVGDSGVTALNNGNFVVSSESWTNGAVTDVGAVTWVDGSTGITGLVSSSNSLIGSTDSDSVGSNGVTALTNGNYVALSSRWNNGAATRAGAVTWGNGNTGITGVVSASNSLVGGTAGDNVGGLGVTALSNGNYVVGSPGWDHGTVTDVGAVTWGNGSTGLIGAVSTSNSLVGSTASDQVGSLGSSGVTALSNGNYVVSSRFWDYGAVANAGAVTWGNGSTGTTGVVSGSNSLVGSATGDNVGIRSATALSNGNYVVNSYFWNNGAATRAGAVTWGNGGSGISGVVSSTNSLVGSKTNDNVGSSGVTALGNGNYAVSSRNWDNGAVTDAGAVTWGNGSTGTSGVVSTSNSLVGSKASDFVGFIVTALSNGNYVVNNQNWDNGALANAGAASWGNGSGGTTGVVNGANSLLGQTATGGLALMVVDDINQTFFGRFGNDGSGRVRVGSQENGVPVLPFITAPTSTAITTATATLGAHVTAPGAAAITERGVVYSLTSANADPLISGSGVTKAVTTGTTGVFAVPVAVIASVSGYSFKGYAINSFGTNYTAVSTFATTTAAALFSSSMSSAALTGNDALPDAIPFNDGVENLVKYAFNMNLAGPDSATMAEGGTAGLPTINPSGTGASGVLCFEFVRRKNSGLVYTPKKSTSLDPTGWTSLTDPPTVTPIGTDGLWERVIYEEPSDPAVVPACFGRVEVAIP